MHVRFKAFLAGSLLSRMGDHLAEFGLMLILLERYPGRLAPALGFGITRGIIALAIGRRLGALFDRFPTRAVLTAAIGLQMVSLTAFALVSLLPDAPPHLFWLCGAGLVVGSFTFGTGLTYSLLPQLAEGAALTRLNAVFHSLVQVGRRRRLSAPLRHVAAQSQAGAAGSSYQRPLLVEDVALGQADGVSPPAPCIPRPSASTSRPASGSRSSARGS